MFLQWIVLVQQFNVWAHLWTFDGRLRLPIHQTFLISHCISHCIKGVNSGLGFSKPIPLAEEKISNRQTMVKIFIFGFWYILVSDLTFRLDCQCEDVKKDCSSLFRAVNEKVIHFKNWKLQKQAVSLPVSCCPLTAGLLFILQSWEVFSSIVPSILFFLWNVHSMINNLLYSSTISYTPQDLLSIQYLLNSSGSSISSWSPTSSGSSIASGSPKFFRISYLQILIKIWFSSAPHWAPLMLNRYFNMKQII